MSLYIRVGVLLAVLPLGAFAIGPGPVSRAQQDTENWLQLQISGKAQSPIRQVATSQERERSLQRWLDSYTHPIPEYYKQDEGGSGKSD